MDKYAFTIERARLKALEAETEAARLNGQTDRYAELVREVRKSKLKLQQILQSR